MVQRAYKERCYPTPEQSELLGRSFGCARFVWNDALRLRTEASYQRGESLSHAKLEKRLVTLKADYPWLVEVSSVILQQVLRDQQQAFKHFWDKLSALQIQASASVDPADPGSVSLPEWPTVHRQVE